MRTARRRRRRSAWRQRAGGRAGDRGGSGPRAGRRRAESWRDGGRRDLPRAGPSCQAEGRPRSAPAQRPGRRQLAGRGRDDARALEDSNSQHSPGRVEPREGKPAPLRIRDPGGEMGRPLPPPPLVSPSWRGPKRRAERSSCFAQGCPREGSRSFCLSGPEPGSLVAGQGRRRRRRLFWAWFDETGLLVSLLWVY